MVVVIGHKNPDTDSVVCAVAMSSLLKLRGQEAIPAIAGVPNSETKFLFERFCYDIPEIKETVNDDLFLVDHNEESQRIPGNVIGIVDHHRILLETSDPIELVCKPWGCCSSIIFDMFKKENFEIPSEIKPLLLGAILSDTVILKSPTTTEVDKSIAEELASELNIDISSFGMELFKAKSQIASKSAKEILMSDYKEFEVDSKKFGIGQVETPDLSEVELKIPELLDVMNKKMVENELNSVILMLTDIVKEGSKLLVVGITSLRPFNTSLNDGVSEFIPGMLSRKKQIAPFLYQL